MTEYGVDGTDTVSDSSALQDVLYSALQIPEGKTLKVYIPSGTYYLDRGVNVFSNTEIKMDPDTYIYGMDGITKGFFRGDEEIDPDPKYSKRTNIKITGGVFVGTNVKTVNCAFLYFDHCSDFILEDITFRDSFSRHAVTLDAIDGLTARGLVFENCKRYVNKDGSTPDEDTNKTAEAFHIDHIPYGKNDSGAYPNNDGTSCKNILVENCTFKNVNSGVGCHYYSDTHQGENITIQNCTFRSVDFASIDLACFDNIQVLNNNSDNGAYFMHIKRCSGLIKGNTITNTRTYTTGKAGFGICITACDTNTSKDKPLVITENTIKNTKTNAIHISSSGDTQEEKLIQKYITVSNNTIINSDENGIRADNAAYLTISGNQVSGVDGNGIHMVKVSDLAISDNTVKNAKNNGISLSEVTGYSKNNTAENIYRYPNCYDTFRVWELNGLKKENGDMYYYEEGLKISGWRTNPENGNKYYFSNTTKKALTGLNTIGEKKYYFHTNGVLKVNQKFKDESSGKTYYATADGEIPVSKVFKVGTNTYMSSSTGALLSGWREDGKKKYFFSKTSFAAETGLQNHTDDGNSYYFNANGVLQTGWIDIGAKRYRANAEGVIIKNKVFKAGSNYYMAATLGALQTGWKKSGKNMYYFDPETYAAKTGFVTIKGAQFYFTAKGVMKSGFFSIGKKRYYAKPTGSMAKLVKNKLFTVGGKVYYAKKDGSLKTGWLQLGKVHYFFDPKTYQADVGFKKRGGKLYYFSPKGAMRTGWIYIGNKTYHADKNGVVAVNKKFSVGSHVYKANAKGVVTQIK